VGAFSAQRDVADVLGSTEQGDGIMAAGAVARRFRGQLVGHIRLDFLKDEIHRRIAVGAGLPLRNDFGMASAGPATDGSGQLSRVNSSLLTILPQSIVYGSADARLLVVVEFHSIGGHSGSPVFFLYPMTLSTPMRHEESGTNYMQYDQAHVSGFMGLVTGHYPIVAESANGLNDSRVELNSGIAVVTPACEVKDLLMRKDFIEQRKKLRKSVESKGSPTPRMDFGDASGFTRDDMERELKKVSRRVEPEQSAEESSGT
ncbi:MAG: hypothetical protein IH864_05245, partial [Chloroflexi bacterium]|nr:hypothetical protein [Chloroflexota bacterium]